MNFEEKMKLAAQIANHLTSLESSKPKHIDADYLAHYQNLFNQAVKMLDAQYEQLRSTRTHIKPQTAATY